MSESIIQKRDRLFGNAPEGSPAVLKAVTSGQWTPQDAQQLRKHLGNQSPTGKTRQSHADRVALTMKGRT